MIELDNRTDTVYDLSLLDRIAHTLSGQEIELIFVYDDEMAQINKEYRNIGKSTDVLSFPSDPFPNAPLGSIVISVDKVQSVAHQLGHTKEDELALLFIHAMLHLLGMDHEVDTGEMRNEEERLVNFFNLPKSLIDRTLL
jgi:probable rRNA maturation factor